MERVIEGIEAGDFGFAELGIEFIQTNDSFAFGEITKSKCRPCAPTHDSYRSAKEKNSPAGALLVKAGIGESLAVRWPDLADLTESSSWSTSDGRAVFG